MKESILAFLLFILGAFTMWLLDKTNPVVISQNEPIIVDKVQAETVRLDSLTTMSVWQYRLDIGLANDYLTIVSDKPLGYSVDDTLKILTHKGN